MSQLHQTDLIRLRPLQFSLRQVIAVGILMAVLFLVLGPWLRQFPQQLVAIVVGVWFVAVAIFCAVLAFGSVYFRNVRRRAGPILCVLPRVGHLRDCLLFTALNILQILVAIYCTRVSLEAFGPAYVAGPSYNAGMATGSWLNTVALFAALLWLIAFSLGGATLFMLRSEYAALCENGLIHVAIFVRWQRVCGVHWQEKGGRLRVVLRSRWVKTWKFEVAEEDRAEVEAILDSVRQQYHGAAEQEAGQELADQGREQT